MKTSLRLDALEYQREKEGPARIVKWMGGDDANPQEQGFTLAAWDERRNLVFTGSAPLRLSDGEQAIFWQLVEFGYADLED